MLRDRRAAISMRRRREKNSRIASAMRQTKNQTFSLVSVMSNLIQQFEAAQMTRKLPEFSPGDTVIVNVKVKEGNRERVQAYEGVVIARKNAGLNSAFTVRKISHGTGVERVPVAQPGDRFGRREAPRQSARREALLPARPRGQEGAHQGRSRGARGARCGRRGRRLIHPRHLPRQAARPKESSSWRIESRLSSSSGAAVGNDGRSVYLCDSS